MNKLQQMEDYALKHGYCMREFGNHVWLEVFDEGTWFRYAFNGEYKLREQVIDLIPNNSEPFKDI